MGAVTGYVDMPARPAFAGTGSLVIDTLPFKPVAMRFFTNHEPADGWLAGTVSEGAHFSAGFATMGGQQFCLAGTSKWLIAHQSDHSTAAFNDRVVAVSYNAPMFPADISLAVNTWDCNGVTLDIVPAGVAAQPAFRAYFTAYSSMTLQVTANYVVVPAGGPAPSVTLGFQPDLIEFMSIPVGAFETNLASTNRFVAGAATGSYQGYQSWYANADFVGDENNSHFGGDDAVTDNGISVASIDTGGFTLAGSPADDTLVMFVAYADPNGDFFATRTPWASGATALGPGFPADAVTAFYSGGQNITDSYGGMGFADIAGNVGSAWNAFYTGMSGTEVDLANRAQQTNGAVLLDYLRAGTLQATQTVTIDSDVTLTGSANVSPGTADILVSAVRLEGNRQCPTIVSFSPVTDPYRRFGPPTIK